MAALFFLSRCERLNIDPNKINQDQTQRCLGFLGSRSLTQTIGFTNFALTLDPLNSHDEAFFS